MSRRVGALLTALGLAVALLAGCGIPGQTDVRVDGPGPRPGAGGGGESVDGPKSRSATNASCATSSEDQCSTAFIDNFLAAPAGEWEQMDERVNDFVIRDAQDELDFGSVSVVELEGQPTFKGTEATIKVRHIGVLLATGELAPPREDADDTYTIQVGNIEGSPGLYVLSPPSALLMSRTALNEFYSPRTIYFWNAARTMLVPDLRYLPVTVPAARIPTEVLTWLSTGPAQSLGDAAQGLPEGGKLSGTAPIDDDGALTTSWSPETFESDGDYDRLATQIVWSLGTAYSFNRLVIEVSGAPKRDTDDIERLRSGVTYPVSSSPERYAIVEGAVRRLSGSTGPPPSPLLGPEANRDLRSAAFLRTDKVLAAAIVDTGDGGRELRVGSGAGTVAALRATVPTLRTDARPAWLPAAQVGLVPADGKLWRFGADGRAAELKLPGIGGRVTSVAVSPEGQRIAVIADGDLYLVPLAILGAGPTITAKPARRIPTVDGLTAVAWSSETRVVVAGPTANGRSQLVDVTIDGFGQTLRTGDVPGTVTQIGAYPDVPMLRTRIEPVVFESGDQAWRLERVTTQIARTEVVGETASPGPGTDGAKPTSPFYVY